MATLKDLASQYGLEDYKQLLSGYPNATKFANALQSGIESHIPTTEDLQSPERMGEWSLSAALNQPTGLTFIGKNAKNWDAQAAKLAEEKLNAGADPAEVWREHLIGRMPDKTLFSEISDKDALYHQHGKDFYDSTFNKMDQLLKNGRDTAGDPLNAQDMLAHPNFYENYPNLKTTELRYLPETSTAKGAFGYFADNGDPVLSVYGMLPNNEAKSTMLHELQHAVQGKEGWGQGGNPEYFTKQKEAERARDILNWRSEVLARKKKYPDADRSAIENNIIKDYSDMGLFEFLPERDLREMATQPYLMYPEQYSHGAEELEKLNNLVKEYGLDKRTTPYKPFEAYKRLAGEAQARATQDRLNMDMAQRRENYPLAGGKLSDIPLDELIYKYEGSGPSLSTDALSKYKDYVGEHTAPLGESGVPLHDLTANDNSVYPSDVYSPQANQYYGSGEPEDAQLFAMAKRLKDKPNEKVTIYRAVPKVQSNSEKIAQIEKDMAKYLKTGKMPSNSSFRNKSDWYDWASDERDRLASLPEETIEPLSINHGDWVALDRKYAKEHGESALRGNYKILSKKVPARQLFTNGDSIREWGWDSRYAKGGSVDIMSKLDALAGGGDYLADLEQLKRAYPNATKFFNATQSELEESVPTTEQMRNSDYLIEHLNPMALSMGAPEKTVNAYKLFRTKANDPDTLYPLFVNADKPVLKDEWIPAEVGEPASQNSDKVKSLLGPLAYRPGWHAGDVPVATHIGKGGKPPVYRPSEHTWAEVQFPNDVDWQTLANERGMNNKGVIVPKFAHITDQLPEGGFYRYKTSPNMTGQWLIGGSMKLGKHLTDDEVKAINEASGLGVEDLPRFHEYLNRNIDNPTELSRVINSTAGKDEYFQMLKNARDNEIDDLLRRYGEYTDDKALSAMEKRYNKYLKQGYADGGMVGTPPTAYDPMKVADIVASIDAPHNY